jgi:Uma2 family endonuclease
MNYGERVRMLSEEFLAFAELPENRDRKLELIAGEVIEKPMPKPMHGIVANIIAFLINLYLQKNPVGQLVIEVQYRVPGGDYAPIPDLSFISAEQPAFALDEVVPYMPALAIEIQSPDQPDKEMSDKANYYLQHGSRMVWILYPDRKLVEVLTLTTRRLLTADQTLDGGDVLPGFSTPVKDVFPN